MNISLQEITLKINDVLVKLTIEDAKKLKAILEKLLEYKEQAHGDKIR